MFPVQETYTNEWFVHEDPQEAMELARQYLTTVENLPASVILGDKEGCILALYSNDNFQLFHMASYRLVVGPVFRVIEGLYTSYHARYEANRLLAPDEFCVILNPVCSPCGFYYQGQFSMLKIEPVDDKEIG